MTDNRITVFGGTGYLGRHIVQVLVDEGYRVRVAVRNPQPDLFSGWATNVEQVPTDVRDDASIGAAMHEAWGIVNAVGLYVERGPDTFRAVHVQGAAAIADQTRKSGATLIHVSGIGANSVSRSRYVRARGEGEQQVRVLAPEAIILRPSVLFGEHDAFLSTLAKIIRVAPVVPLFGSGATRLQPVYVDDVARAVATIFKAKTAPDRIYELGGPKVYLYRELIEIVMRHLGKKRLLLPIPFGVWELQARMAALLPSPPLTRDQVELMRHDNVTDSSAGTFTDLGIPTQSLEALLSTCLPPA